MKTVNNHVKKWIVPKPINEPEIKNCTLNYTLQKVLIRRGFDLKNELEDYITPLELPNSEDHFVELNKATKRIIEACARNEQIAVCGDYDADGITSTVLLVELFSKLGAKVTPYIPSRQDDGYGLNLSMVNEINKNKTKLIITVDNGISAFSAIKRSNELGIDLIITDHHKIPDIQLDIFSLIHPELTPINSPYKYLAGVGIAYLLANNICNKLDYDINNTSADILFCVGTVADMAPLLGANRKWLKDSLPKIRTTKNRGFKSIIKTLSLDKIDITSDDIGFKIAPLINAVGRIGDPKQIINLLINESTDSIDKLTKDCFAMNRERKRITALIEKEALEIALSQYRNDRQFLVLTKKEWHPGVIGIVAARMVDKFNLPTALIAPSNDGKFRGSIRSNNVLKVNHALDECHDLLISHGGHSGAAGFSINEENIPELMERLNIIAKREFKYHDINMSIKPDAHVSLNEINYNFYRQLCLLGPFGMKNPAPIFWTRKCRVLEINKLKGGHMKIKLNDGTRSIEAIKWNEFKNIQVNELVDVAFYIEINKWKSKNNLFLNIIDIKKYTNIIDLQLHNKLYKCQLTDKKEILITNTKGQSISSDISICSDNLNETQKAFAKKIIGFAEIALGKAA